jgi:hypothetical protein
MAGPTEDEIRTRALELWEEAGRPDGEMERFWYAAKQELLQESGDGPPPRCPAWLKVGSPEDIGTGSFTADCHHPPSDGD